MTSPMLLVPLWVALVAAGGWRFRPRRLQVTDRSRTTLSRPGLRPSTAPPTMSRRIVRLAGVTGLAALVDLRVAVALGVVTLMWPILADRRTRAERERKVTAGLPEFVDFFVVAMSAGMTVSQAVLAVTTRTSGVVSEAFERALMRASLSARLAEELRRVPDEIGEQVRPLIRALCSADQYGVPIAQALERLSVDVRIERRRRAEIAARRLPVTLLFPLVLCTLPAFVLLTVVPVLVSSLADLRFG